MSVRLSAPIGILDEHPEWSARLNRRARASPAAVREIDHSNHAFDPRDRAARYSVIVQSHEPLVASPGSGGVLFYAERCSRTGGAGVPVINSLRAYRFENPRRCRSGSSSVWR